MNPTNDCAVWTPPTASFLRSLQGSVVRFGSVSLTFDGEATDPPTCMRGGEGYAVPVHLNGSTRLPAMLKAFFLGDAARAARTRFLTELGLYGCPGWLGECAFAAAPRLPVDLELHSKTGEQIRVVGHVAARLLCARSLRSLRIDAWEPGPDVRAQLARQLCSVVNVMERVGLVHGDLSVDNVLVDYYQGAPCISLIDYDGFGAQGIPPVTYAQNAVGGRAWGAAAYRSPKLEPGPDVVLTSDRIALALLVVELVSFSGEDWASMQRESLRDEDTPQTESDVASALAEVVRPKWPAGAAMLEAALQQSDPASAPSPREWARAVAHTGVTHPSVAVQNVRLRTGVEGQPRMTLRVTGRGIADRSIPVDKAGTLADLDAALADVRFALTPMGLCLRGSFPDKPIAFIRSTQDASLLRCDGASVDLPLGGTLIWGDYRAELQIS